MERGRDDFCLKYKQKASRPIWNLQTGVPEKVCAAKNNNGGAPKMFFTKKHFGERKNSEVNERQLFKKD